MIGLDAASSVPIAKALSKCKRNVEFPRPMAVYLVPNSISRGPDILIAHRWFAQ
jgi:hypothetical protein